MNNPTWHAEQGPRSFLQWGKLRHGVGQTLARTAKAVDSPGGTWGRTMLVHTLARAARRHRELAGLVTHEPPCQQRP